MSQQYSVMEWLELFLSPRIEAILGFIFFTGFMLLWIGLVLKFSPVIRLDKVLWK